MRSQSMRAISSQGLFALVLSLPLLGCLTEVEPGAGQEGATCESDKNCREGYVCAPGVPRICRLASDGGIVTDARGDGSQPVDVREAVSDGRADLGSTLDGAPEARTPDMSGSEVDAAADQPDAPQPDIPAPQPDALEAQTDAPQPQSDVPALADTRPADTSRPDTLPCNGGCCSNADCGPDKPVCNGANQCVGCKNDTDCTGRTLAACNATTGACVQCTQSKPCTSPLTCDTSKNQCVGCTTRSDCSGACQACSNGSCVPVKSADDPTQCTGTCDSTGQCKAKQGQECTAASDCLNNMTCADGTCCNRACTGACEACDLPTALGTCTVLPAGSQPHHGTCAGTGTGVTNAACAGSCQGNATCSYPPNTTVCGTTNCNSEGQAQAAGTCNGTGLCALPPAVTCKTGSFCSAGGCECLASLPDDCPSACVSFDTDSKNCGACGHDCLGGTCQDGICQPVVVLSPDTSYRMAVFGLDAQYLYYENSSISPFSTNHERMSLSSGTVTTLRTDTQARGMGVIGGTAYFSAVPMGKPMYCNASNCANTIYELANGLIEFGHPSPPYYVIKREAATTQFLELTWYTTGNTVVTSWPDNVSPENDSAFTAFGNSVYWLRQTSTTRELLSVDSTNPSSITRKPMAGQLPTGCTIANINTQSLLLLCTSGLYRVPMPNGMSDDPPTSALSAASNVRYAIEDGAALYWADSIGSIYKCPSNDLPSCAANQILLTTGAPTTGFFQDSKYLYWGTVAESEPAKAQLLRMAK